MSNPSSTKEYMKEFGIKILFRHGRYGSYGRREDAPLEYTIKSKLLKSKSLISKHLNAAIADNDKEVLFSLFRHAEDAEINLYSVPFWREPVKAIANQLLEDEASAYDIYSGNRDYAITAAKMLENFDWKDLFKKVYTAQCSNNYIRVSYKRILEMYAFTSPESFKTFAEEEVFFSKSKPSFATRGSIYSEYITGGHLALKTARKIRSDASEEASAIGLKALVANKELYDNYDDLLLQFTDSKYDSVIVHLAENLPEYLIASIMGTQSYWAKKAVEDRLERIEAEREVRKLELEAEALGAIT